MKIKAHKKWPLLIAFCLFAWVPYSFASDEKPEHLLDGISMDYFYQNGSGIHIEFYDGKVRFEWIDGPAKGVSRGDIPYRSRKIGDEMYLVNFHEEEVMDFITLIFNLKQNVMYSSALAKYGTDRERTIFFGGIIEHLERN